MGSLVRLLGAAVTATYLTIVVGNYRYARRPLDLVDQLAIGIAIAGALIFAFAAIRGDRSRRP